MSSVVTEEEMDKGREFRRIARELADRSCCGPGEEEDSRHDFPTEYLCAMTVYASSRSGDGRGGGHARGHLPRRRLILAFNSPLARGAGEKRSAGGRSRLASLLPTRRAVLEWDLTCVGVSGTSMRVRVTLFGAQNRSPGESGAAASAN